MRKFTHANRFRLVDNENEKEFVFTTNKKLPVFFTDEDISMSSNIDGNYIGTFNNSIVCGRCEDCPIRRYNTDDDRIKDYCDKASVSRLEIYPILTREIKITQKES